MSNGRRILLMLLEFEVRVVEGSGLEFEVKVELELTDPFFGATYIFRASPLQVDLGRVSGLP